MNNNPIGDKGISNLAEAMVHPLLDDCVRAPIMAPLLDDCVREPIMDPLLTAPSI